MMLTVVIKNEKKEKTLEYQIEILRSECNAKPCTLEINRLREAQVPGVNRAIPVADYQRRNQDIRSPPG